MLREKKMEATEIEISDWKEFEVEAYRIENQLAAERNWAESRLRAIESSRTWRLTAPVRRFIDFVARPLMRSHAGLKLIRWLDARI